MNTAYGWRPPAGQVSAPAPAAPVTTTAPSAAPVAPATPATTDAIQFGPDGRIAGLDGILDQIASAVAKQVVPIVRDTALPILQRDVALQRTVGEAAGRGAVKALRPVLWFFAGMLAVVTYVYYRNSRRYWRVEPEATRGNPTKPRRRPSRLGGTRAHAGDEA